MKPSETVDLILDLVPCADPDDCTGKATCPECAKDRKAILPLITAAEKAAFEAGMRYGETADLEGHDMTYDDWQKERK